MTVHDGTSGARRRCFDISLITEAIDYDLGPRVSLLGGDVWLEDVLHGRLIVRIQAPPGDGERVRRLVHAALVQLFDGDETAFDLKSA